MMFFGIILWLGFCFLVAKIGANRNIGYWGAFFLSFLLSPIIGIVFVFLSDEIRNEYCCKHCGFKSSVNSDFCPACGKDSTGKDKDAYKKISESNEGLVFLPQEIPEDKHLISSHLIKIFVLFFHVCGVSSRSTLPVTADGRTLKITSIKRSVILKREKIFLLKSQRLPKI